MVVFPALQRVEQYIPESANGRDSWLGGLNHFVDDFGSFVILGVINSTRRFAPPIRQRTSGEAWRKLAS